MQTFKFNDVKLGYDRGCNVTIRAEDAHEAMKRFIAWDAEKLREGPAWMVCGILLVCIRRC